MGWEILGWVLGVLWFLWGLWLKGVGLGFLRWGMGGLGIRDCSP